MKKYNVGFIGYGNMSQAIVAALKNPVSVKFLKYAGFKLNIAVSDNDANKLSDVPEGVKFTTDNQELISACDLIVLAVKPQNAAQAVDGLDFSGKIVMSIMASVTIKALSELINGKTDKIVRVMPNLNARIASAYSAFCVKGLSGEEYGLVKAILSTFGEADELKEEQMNAATGLSGSGPAFVFKFINALAEGGAENGLDKAQALKMALATVIGSAYLVESGEGGNDISELVKSVCSKGGTTIEGVKHLDENNFEKTVAQAVTKAVKRAEEMSKSNEKG